MPLPPSVTKVSKGGVKFVSSVDRAQYTIKELTRAALRDVAKILIKKVRAKIKYKTGNLVKNTQYWNRAKSSDLQIGFKPGGFYGLFQEIGGQNVKKQGALRETVYENIPLIVEIESKYLSALEDEAKALALIDESEVIE